MGKCRGCTRWLFGYLWERSLERREHLEAQDHIGASDVSRVDRPALCSPGTNNSGDGDLPEHLIVGVVMLNTRFPRLFGDIGNPATLSRRGLYRRVSAATVASIVNTSAIASDVTQPVVSAVSELESLGADVIVTSCGFLHEIQETLQHQVSVPVVSSALTLLPQLLAESVEGKVGIMTFDAERLTERHLGGADVTNRCVVVGMESSSHFHPVIAENREQADPDRLRADVLDVAEVMKETGPSAVILECTNLSPWKSEIQAIVGVPVLDLLDAVRIRMSGPPARLTAVPQGPSESASS